MEGGELGGRGEEVEVGVRGSQAAAVLACSLPPLLIRAAKKVRKGEIFRAFFKIVRPR